MSKLKSAAFLFTLLVPVASRGQEAVIEAPRTEDPTVKALADAAFSPLVLPARVGFSPAFAWATGGYDSARKSRLFDSVAEVTVWGPIALRGGATYSADTTRVRPSVGARAQLLRQEAHGLDGVLAVVYKAEGFTEAEGEIETVAAVGCRFSAATAIANLAYGQDPEGNERDGEVRATVFRQRAMLSYGLDARLRFAIGTQHGRSATTEPTFDFTGGPTGAFVVGPIALFAEAGPSLFRLGGATRVGVAALGGLGRAF